MKVAYWICTVIIAWIMGAGGIYDLMKPPEAMEIFRRLGYMEDRGIDSTADWGERNG